MEKIIEIKNLTVKYSGATILEDVNFTLAKGEVLAIVGESGSGKTMTGLAMLNLLPRNMRIENGEILFNGRDVLKMGKEETRKLRGKNIAMVFQEPFTALNPVMRVEEQVSEALLAHGIVNKFSCVDKMEELFTMVKLPIDALKRYPHELSGGMRQRVMIAMALSCDPDVLILDEPTTALDVSIQKHILDLVRDIQKQKSLATLFITHDFSVVKLLADRVCVMKKGRIVEMGTKDSVLNSPKDAYTKHLISCIPRLGDKRSRLASV